MLINLDAMRWLIMNFPTKEKKVEKGRWMKKEESIWRSDGEVSWENGEMAGGGVIFEPNFVKRK